MTEQIRKGRPPLPVDVRKVQHNMLWPPALLARIKAKALERKVPVSTIVTEVMSDYFKKTDLFNGEKITITEQDILECNAWDPWGDTQD